MILLMGIAGSGKGTQGQLLAEKLGYRLLSMGDVVRQHASAEQRRRMLAGQLLSDEEVIALLQQTLTELTDGVEVILDGFPRTVGQAQWLLDEATAGHFQLKAAIHLVASKEAVKARLLNRARADDVEEAIEKRFAEYERSTTPILDWLSSHGVNVMNIDAERSIEAVHQDLVKQLAAA